jgi:O-antigen ligase
VLVPALLLTSSRGAWVALLAGLAALALLRGTGLRPRVLAPIAGAAVAVCVAVVVVTDGSLGSLTENRLRYWEVAWADFRDHPLLGSGAGTFGDYWLTHESVFPFTRTAHSLYVQSLAELGPVGLLLSLALVAVPLLALAGRRDPLVAAAAGGYVAFVVHAGIDWDWELPAVTLAGLFCGGALLVATRPDRVPALGRATRLALAAAALAPAVFAALRLDGGGPFP